MLNKYGESDILIDGLMVCLYSCKIWSCIKLKSKEHLVSFFFGCRMAVMVKTASLFILGYPTDLYIVNYYSRSLSFFVFLSGIGLNAVADHQV